KAEAAAKRQAEKEAQAKQREQERIAQEQARLKEEKVQREEKIARLIKKAKSELEHNDFSGAKRIARKALNVEDNKEARQLLAVIDKAETTYMKDQEEKKKEAEEKRQEELKTRNKAEEEARQARKEAREKEEAKRRANKIANYLSRANLQLANNRFNQARENVRKALDLDKENKQAKTLLETIDWAEDVYKKQKGLKEENSEKQLQ
ncbi:MAG: hypothetical protein WBD12_06765, partial [Candidatus Omnitrophota bacterium]